MAANVSPDTIKEAAELILNDIRGRRLLGDLFEEDPGNVAGYGHVDAPIDTETQHECAEKWAALAFEARDRALSVVPPDLKVVSLHAQAMAADIVGSMRRAADSIESETEEDDRTVTGIYVTVSQAGAVKLYGWGKVGSRFEAIGFLHAAIADQL